MRWKLWITRHFSPGISFTFQNNRVADFTSHMILSHRPFVKCNPPVDISPGGCTWHDVLLGAKCYTKTIIEKPGVAAKQRTRGDSFGNWPPFSLPCTADDVATCTVWSKSNIPCCALLARKVRTTFAWCTRATWRTSYANLARNICVTYAPYSRRMRAHCRTRSAQQGMLPLDPSVRGFLLNRRDGVRVSRLKHYKGLCPLERITLRFNAVLIVRRQRGGK
jgi:hypothetical protein